MNFNLVKGWANTGKYKPETINEEKKIATYVLDFDIKVTKPQIKKIFEKSFADFDLKVTSVNTIISPLKKKRVGLKKGYKTRYKRAIIKLKPNQKIAYATKKETNNKKREQKKAFKKQLNTFINSGNTEKFNTFVRKKLKVRVKVANPPKPFPEKNKSN